MAGRIRSIKPDVLAEPRIAKLTDAARVLLFGLYSLADDAGNCPAGPSYIRGQIFYERHKSLIAIGKLLAELECARLIDRYVADGQQYLAIIGWGERSAPTYQRIDKPQDPKYPLPRSVRSWNEFQPGSEGIGKDKGTEGEREDEPAAGRASGSGDTRTGDVRAAAQHVRKIPTGEVIPDRPAQPELVPGDVVTVDSQGNVCNAGPFVALFDELNRRGEP